MFNKSFHLSVFILITTIIFLACSTEKQEFKISYEKYTLKNGLEVILHEDKSDPITAVAVLYHVGSNRETKGKTGFAHLFEHMMFQESQHVGQDQFFKKIQNAGGTLNGGTWNDGTVYFQVVPNNALEMVLWMESDRMGWLLSTVTQEAFENQQAVVQNEKRQRYDNQPYGQTNYVIDKLLYPDHHPYNWQTIGELEDLQNATLEDVHNFYKKWYSPNNATLVIAGDFDKEKTKEWVEKYFGEIKSSEKVNDMNPMPVVLDTTRKAYHVDKFAPSPELNMVFPTVEEYTKDSYALNFLAELFAGSKKSPLYKIIVEEKKLAPSVSANQNSEEIAGDFRIRVRAFPDKNITDVERAINEAFEKFEKEGFSEKDVERIKIKTETNFYNGISSVLGKSFQLASYNEYAGSPDFVTTDLDNIRSVKKEDILSVYQKYIKNKPFILTSFVPEGKQNLVAEGSELFPIKEESIEAQSKLNGKNKTAGQYKVEKIPSSFDRNIEPASGSDPEFNVPSIWDKELSNGIKIIGIEQNELPLVQFSVTVKGGMLQDDINKIGVANLISDMMMEGTEDKTPVELEEAIDDLGASITMHTTKESIVLQANCLSSKLAETFKLAEEILFKPRWDEKEFARIKDETIETINRNKSNPNAVAGNVFNKLIYGKDNLLGYNILGSEESVKSITINDLKEFYKSNFAPSITTIQVVGNINQDDAISIFSSLEKKWQEKDIKLKEFKVPAKPKAPSLYFVDFPDAKQSVIMIGNIGLKYTDNDFYPATVMNYKLGGSFNGNVNLILREEKGYTYGARTAFSGSQFPGTFTASSSVRSNTTLESAEIFVEEMNKYRDGIPEEDLEFTKNALIKSDARNFETLGALRNMLEDIAMYNLPYDYVKQREVMIKNMTLEEHKKLADKYIDPNVMTYVVVGDAKTQLEPLRKLGVGNPVLLDRDGNLIK